MFIIFMGVSGCGKTTIGKMTAEVFDIPYYEGDAYHPAKNVNKMAQGIPLTDEDRAGWLEKLADIIRQTLEKGEFGVLSCSALKKKYRDQLRVDQDRVQFIYLKGDYPLILGRMEGRTGHYMPPGLLKSQFEALEEPENAFIIEIDQEPEEILQQVIYFLDEIGFCPD